MTYHDTVQDVYRKAALAPDATLCCVPRTPKYLPGLHVPDVMRQMDYGCGTTVHDQDMTEGQTVLYVGVGGGLEALELAYFARRPGGVIAIDPVAEMRDTAKRNLEDAAATNDWFDPSFVEIRDGDALDLPVDDATIDLAAQNCLFNIFKTTEEGTDGQQGDLEKALSEMFRVLKPNGRLSMSDPITPRPMPQHLMDDEELRALCLSGCLTYDRYINKIIETGFGSGEVRSRRPYRLLTAQQYGLDSDLLLETLEIAAFKTPMPDDGACVFTGRYAIYAGEDKFFDDKKGHVLMRGMPLAVCDKTAGNLAALRHPDIRVTESTWHYQGGGCC